MVEKILVYGGVAVIVIAIIAFNIWNIKFEKAERLRKSLLSPEQRAKEDIDDWYDRQW